GVSGSDVVDQVRERVGLAVEELVDLHAGESRGSGKGFANPFVGSRLSEVVVRRLAHVFPLIAAGAASVAVVPYTPLRVLGPLTVALLLGMALRPVRFVRTMPRADVGWLSRDVLRAGVVLVGARLDWIALTGAGARPIAVALTAVGAGLVMFAV